MIRFALILMLLASPAYAQYKIGYGLAGGVLEGQPSTSLHLEIEEPHSQIHLRPRIQSWKPEGEPGVWELGLDAYYHFLPCFKTSFYLGGGLGIEWIVPSAPPVTICECAETPPPLPPDPPQPEALVFGGVRFPGNRVDGFIEARHYIGVEDRKRSGVFVGLGFHQARKKH